MLRKLFLSALALGLAGACSSAPPLLTPERQAQVDLGEERPPFDAASIYFNSRETASKSPFGAVVAGSTVTYRVSARRGDLDGVSLMVATRLEEGNREYTDYVDYQEIPLNREPADEASEVWTGSHTFETPAIYGYFFALKKGGRSWALGNNRRQLSIAHESAMGTGGLGRITREDDIEFYRQTVYFPETVQAQDPAWEQHIVYYIFPERFKNGNRANDPKPGTTWFYGGKSVEFHTNWNDPKPWVPGTNRDGHGGDDAEYNNDFYGGDLAGIIQKLDYLKDLGVSLIYTTPIFTSPSNHKYDTIDYMSIDPHFGTLADFRTLVAEGRKRGIGILLDASLNHASSASLYFDKYSIHPTNGAFEGGRANPSSPYYDWFEINERSNTYAYWAVDTLANLKESEGWKAFSYRNPDSVTKYWLEQGAAGWRMDVAPWVSHEYWKDWRRELKAAFPNALTVAEVWFDTSHFLYGDEFDSTMNYIFRSAALALGRGTPTDFSAESLLMIQENYPRAVFHRLMNLTGTHDVPRTFYELGYRENGQANYAQVRPRYLLTEALKFAIPGMPTIYYGEEIGITGGADPLNRGPFPWPEDGGDYGDWTLVEEVKALSRARRANPAVWASGELKLLQWGGQTLALSRTAGDGAQGFALFNNGTEAAAVSLPNLNGAFTDALTGADLSLEGSLELPPLSYRYLLKK